MKPNGKLTVHVDMSDRVNGSFQYLIYKVVQKTVKRDHFRVRFYKHFKTFCYGIVFLFV